MSNDFGNDFGIGCYGSKEATTSSKTYKVKQVAVLLGKVYLFNEERGINRLSVGSKNFEPCGWFKVWVNTCSSGYNTRFYSLEGEEFTVYVKEDKVVAKPTESNSIKVERDLETIVKREFLKWCLHHNLELPKEKPCKDFISCSKTLISDLYNGHSLSIEVSYDFLNEDEVGFYCEVEADRRDKEQNNYLLHNSVKQSFFKKIIIEKANTTSETLCEALNEALGKYERTLTQVINIAESLEE